MIMLGNNIQGNDDELAIYSVEQFYKSLIRPSSAIDSKVKQLRIIYNLDAKQYAEIKKTLPYIVCGVFTPPYRKKDNFAYTELFIVDIDHLGQKGMTLNDLRTRIQQDERVMMCFASPSMDGLKVMFRLKQRCYDANIYSVFYKMFVQHLSEEYGLSQLVDKRTSDVSRACFFSIDAKAYYNSNATAVDLENYVRSDDVSEFFQINSQLIKDMKMQPEEEPVQAENKDPEAEVMQRIKLRLKNKPQVEKPLVYVPEILNQITSDLKSFIEDNDIMVTEVCDIQYGKKFKFRLGLKLAEVNVFYGKRGFKVVKSPKSGTNDELNGLMVELIEDYLMSR